MLLLAESRLQRRKTTSVFPPPLPLPMSLLVFGPQSGLDVLDGDEGRLAGSSVFLRQLGEL